jgi:hypothetical protein
VLELARAYREEQQPVKMVEALTRALSLSPKLDTNRDVATLLWDGAQRSETLEAVFALLEGPMGSRGLDIAYDLASQSKVRSFVRQRAEQTLKSPQLQQRATPALRAALALRQATTCGAIRDRLPQVQAAGDARALVILRRYESRVGCGRRGRQDCYPCLRGDGSLHSAIAAVAKRAAK